MLIKFACTSCKATKFRSLINQDVVQDVVQVDYVIDLNNP